MRQIDLESWPRYEHFKHFSAIDHPQFGLSANVDLTAYYAALKERGISFTTAVVYAVSRAANAIPEFRQRIRPGMVVEHEVVHPSITVLGENDLFSFCAIDYDQDFATFAAGALTRMAAARERPTLQDEPGRDDFLFMTAIPWVSFTSFMHPLHLHPVDSVPRFAWGKFFEQGDRLLMPLGVQGHHALMDGLHIGRFYAAVQELVDRPGFLR
jgi:chloramphenicol O-acetyltransferase type A